MDEFPFISKITTTAIIIWSYYKKYDKFIAWNSIHLFEKIWLYKHTKHILKFFKKI